MNNTMDELVKNIHDKIEKFNNQYNVTFNMMKECNEKNLQRKQDLETASILNKKFKEDVVRLEKELDDCDAKLKKTTKGGKSTKKKNKKFRKSRKKISYNKNNGSKNRFHRRQYRRRKNNDIQ